MTDDTAEFLFGWTVHQTGEASMLLSVSTVPSKAEREAVFAGTMEPKYFTAIMTPQQALNLADALCRKATAMMAISAPEPIARH